MPTKGGRRRATQRTLSTLPVATRTRIAPTTPPTIGRPDPSPDPHAEALERFPLRSYIGERYAPAELLEHAGHHRSPAASKLLADGQLLVVRVNAAVRNWQRTFWLVTGPTALDLKVTAFRARLDGLFSELHLDGLDFPYAVAPSEYWAATRRREPYENYWFAQFDGIIWTLDKNVARQLRRDYTEICVLEYLELTRQAEVCPACRSPHLNARYVRGNPRDDEQLQLTCEDCRYHYLV